MAVTTFIFSEMSNQKNKLIEFQFVKLSKLIVD